MVVERFDVFLVTLDPAEGVEIQKTRPCSVISPAGMSSPRSFLSLSRLMSMPYVLLW